MEGSGAIIPLIVLTGIIVVTSLLLNVLSAQNYELLEEDIGSLYDQKINDSITVLNGTAVFLDNTKIDSSNFELKNGSNSIGLGNFSIDYTSGSITLTSGTTYNNTDLNATYYFGEKDIQNNIQEGIAGAFNSQNKSGQYLSIIILAVVISLVIGVVLGIGGNGKGDYVESL